MVTFHLAMLKFGKPLWKWLDFFWSMCFTYEMCIPHVSFPSGAWGRRTASREVLLHFPERTRHQELGGTSELQQPQCSVLNFHLLGSQVGLSLRCPAGWSSQQNDNSMRLGALHTLCFELGFSSRPTIWVLGAVAGVIKIYRACNAFREARCVCRRQKLTGQGRGNMPLAYKDADSDKNCSCSRPAGRIWDYSRDSRVCRSQ